MADWSIAARARQLTRRGFVGVLGAAAGCAALGTMPLAFAQGQYTPGSYTATGRGIGGEVPVTVEFSTDAILTVEVGSNAETPGIGTNAIEALPSAIVEAQSTAIDGVAGATVTSKAILAAVDSCIAQATGAELQDEPLSFVPGFYTTSTTGMLGTFDVAAEFSEDRLLSIEIGENNETLRVGSSALQILADQMVEGQTLDVDSVTGATYSSAAMVAAVEDLVGQAGATPRSFAGSKPAPVTYEDAPHEADVLIVGGGLAGSCAAISAAQEGLDVIVLEALQFTAGNSSLSTGLFLLNGTDIQKANGDTETADEFCARVLEQSGNQKDPAHIRLIADYSQELIDWFGSFGIGFFDQLTSGMHGVAPSMGGALQVMSDTMADLGVAVHYGTKGCSLVVDDAGAVRGVRAVDAAGNEVEYTAQKVVLASGGYGNNPDLIAQSWGEEYRNLVYGGLRGMDGTMLVAATEIGAGTQDMEWPHVDACLEVNKGVTITTTLLSGAGGILIRTDGRRFVEETANHSEVASATMHELGDPYFYEIFDKDAPTVSSSLANKFGVYCNMGLPGVYDTIEDMAAGIDVDPVALRETIENYNAAVRGERPDDFGRETFYEELDAPFYVVKVSNGVAATCGGLKVDIDARVLTNDGTPIENLYAIGETASGIMIGYLGGESLAHASITGMLLGRHLGEELA